MTSAATACRREEELTRRLLHSAAMLLEATLQAAWLAKQATSMAPATMPLLVFGGSSRQSLACAWGCACKHHPQSLYGSHTWMHVKALYGSHTWMHIKASFPGMSLLMLT